VSVDGRGGLGGNDEQTTFAALDQPRVYATMP
jgi:hypothetical protein